MNKEPLIFCAIDTNDIEHAKTLTKSIGPVIGGLKLGMEFFNTFGPQGVEQIREACPEAQIFIDLKFHDIPNTVAQTVKSLSNTLAPAYLNVHASGGKAMMEAAKNACNPNTKLLGVTILTSLDDNELHDIGYTGTAAENVTRLAKLTRDSTLDGIVCSAHEIQLMRNEFGQDFILMVPGIRPAGSDKGDQKRVMTPSEALNAGTTHIVIGRPITQAPDPAKAAQDILDTLK